MSEVVLRPAYQFEPDDGEKLVISKWQQEHNQSCIYRNNSGAIGGATTFSFTPTSVGMVIKIKCACGQEYDATDYKSW